MVLAMNSPGEYNVIFKRLVYQGYCSRSRLALFFLLLTCVLVLPACGKNQLPPEPEEGVLIYAALNPVTNELIRSVEKFNEAHTDAKIEIREIGRAHV